MTDDRDSAPPFKEARIPPNDPTRYSSHRPLRPRDSMGALGQLQSVLDEAHARGYVEGMEEAQAVSLDLFRTVLAQMLEEKFGELSEDAMDCIAEADLRTLETWMLSVASVAHLDALFAK